MGTRFTDVTMEVRDVPPRPASGAHNVLVLVPTVQACAYVCVSVPWAQPRAVYQASMGVHLPALPVLSGAISGVVSVDFIPHPVSVDLASPVEPGAESVAGVSSTNASLLLSTNASLLLSVDEVRHGVRSVGVC